LKNENELSFGFEYLNSNVTLKTFQSNLFQNFSNFNSTTKRFDFFIQTKLKYKSIFSILMANRLNVLKSNTYNLMEPRIEIVFKKQFSIGYQHVYQNLQALTNNGLGPQEDIWQEFAKPLQTKHFMLSYFKDLSIPNLNFSISVFQKSSKNVALYNIGFGSRSFMGVDEVRVEDVVTFGDSKSKGLELELNKISKKYRGWVTYTLSKGVYSFPEINNGNFFASNGDQRHILNLVNILNPNTNWEINASWSFNTGRPVTIPEIVYNRVANLLYKADQNKNNIASTSIVIFSERNAYRFNSTHHLDLSVKHFINTRYGKMNISLSGYNVYNRKNPNFYNIGIDKTESSYKLQKISIFPTIISLNLGFQIE
jgi:hypothetical protein